MNVGPLALLVDLFVYYQRNEYYEVGKEFISSLRPARKHELKFAPCMGFEVTPLEIMNVLRVLHDFPTQRTYELLSTGITLLFSLGFARLCYRRGRVIEMSRVPHHTD